MKTYSVILLGICMVIYPCFSSAQLPINTVSTVSTVVVPGGTASQVVTSNVNSVNGVQPSTNYTVKYNNNGNTSITDFSMSGKSYVQYSAFDTVIIRRVANAYETTNGNKQHIYCQGPASVDNVTFQMPFPVANPVVSNFSYMEKVMKDGYINRGSDNVFNNDATSDLTYNNIERIDFVDKQGAATIHLSSAGYVIAERGGNDAFKIAAITGIDANGNPTSFGPVLSVATSAYGAAIINAPTYVMRKDVSDNVLRPFSLVPTQAVKATFIRFSDLGITSMQKVYGYSLMGNDVTATTSAQLLNYTNSTYFPTTTTNSNGGMDLASAPGLFHTDMVLDVQFVSLTAQNKNCDQLLQWRDEDYQRVSEYQLEKSTDREHFDRIAVIRTDASPVFSYTDKDFKISSYYRVKAMMKDGSYYYSAILFARNNCSISAVTMYPNPATDKLNLNFGSSKTINLVSLVSADGRETGHWSVDANMQAMQIDMSALSRGQYFVIIKETNGSQKTYPVTKQ